MKPSIYKDNGQSKQQRKKLCHMASINKNLIQNLSTKFGIYSVKSSQGVVISSQANFRMRRQKVVHNDKTVRQPRCWHTSRIYLVNHLMFSIYLVVTQSLCFVFLWFAVFSSSHLYEVLFILSAQVSFGPVFLS